MAHLRESTTSNGVLQILHVEWTKASRGGEGGRARNAIPAALPLSLEEFSTSDERLFVEVHRWNEHNGFTKVVRIERHSVPLSTGFRFGCLTVAAKSDGSPGLQLDYPRHTGCGGMPDRWFLNCGLGARNPAASALSVNPGEWVRIRDNGRFDDMDTGNWRYQQVTFNVAWFPARPDPAWFRSRRPTHDLNFLADLR